MADFIATAVEMYTVLALYTRRNNLRHIYIYIGGRPSSTCYMLRHYFLKKQFSIRLYIEVKANVFPGARVNIDIRNNDICT